jgi:hypothetical protein
MVPAGPPPPPPAGVDATAVVAQPAVAANAPEAGSLDELVAPIALYPDALVALILPASTASSDVVLAARYLNAGGNPQEIDSRSWDDSVKALAHYPDVVKWMDENLAWTQRLGAAYLNEPDEVMAAVQRDRSRAQANGVLTTTPQQEVVVDQGAIRIIPAQPDVIYVPRYDPEIIYVERPVYVASDPWLTFGIGFGVGSWLAYDCDWHHRTIWIDPHHRDHWRDRRDWRQPHFPGGSGGIAHDGWRRWAPPPGRRPPHFADRDRWQREPIQPRPMPGTRDLHRDRDRRPDEHASRPYEGGFRPGARVPRPIAPAPHREGRPDSLAQRAEPARADPVRSGEQRRWGERQVRGDGRMIPGSRPVIAPPPAPGNTLANAQPGEHRNTSDALGRHGGANGQNSRRFAPQNGEPRPGVPPPQPRVSPTPIAQANPPVMHRAPSLPPPNVGPRPQPAPAPAVAPAPAAAQPRPQFTPGARVPRVERQDSDRGRGARDRQQN